VPFSQQVVFLRRERLLSLFEKRLHFFLSLLCVEDYFGFPDFSLPSFLDGYFFCPKQIFILG